MQWFWETRGEGEFVPPNISTLLQGWEPSKGLMASELPQHSEVFVRELVQNFVDASNDWPIGQKTGIPKLSFHFLQFEGKDALEKANAMGLEEISQRYKALGPELALSMRLPASDVLTGDFRKLRLLVVTEENTSGMYGPWRRGDKEFDDAGRPIRNKMRDALLATARDSSSAGKGLGSFGEGKKALIGMSKCRTIFAHTAFDPALTDDGAFSRFMGGVYWQNFTDAGKKYTGFAMIGSEVEDGQPRPEPLKNIAAEEKALSLSLPGMESRVGDQDSRTGTTLVFVDPDLEPEQCQEAIVRNWWPLIDREAVKFEIYDWDGQLLSDSNPSELMPFRHLLEAEDQKTVSDWLEADAPALKIEGISTPSERNGGTLKLAIDLRPGVGFSMFEPDQNWSIVAMIRNGMVVNYQHYPRRERDHVPYVRGIFEVTELAQPRSERLLRMAEPPLHNKWMEDKKLVDSEVANHAAQIKTKIGEVVSAFKAEYSRTIPTQELKLPMFQEAFALSSRQGKKKPAQGAQKSEFELEDVSAKLEDLGSGARRGMAERSIRLSAVGMKTSEKLRVKVKIGWEVLQDGSWVNFGVLQPEHVIKWPEDFTQLPTGEFVGLIERNKKVFAWRSQPYKELWTLRPYMEVSATDATIEREGEPNA